MNTLTKIILALSLTGLFFASCDPETVDKNQDCINNLEGTWTVTSNTVHNETVDTAVNVTTPGISESFSFQFVKYSLNDAEEGLMYLTHTITESAPYPDTTYTSLDTSEYKVSEECTKIMWKAVNAHDSTGLTSDITTLTSSAFDIEYTYVSGDTFKYKMSMVK
ncbi:hypothetical protein OAK19_02925 [Aureispira]|nr:hypothetical protein [Aureispira sp.]